MKNDEAVLALNRPVRGEGSKYVYETLQKAILSLELAPGEPLDETTLAQQFDMSRSPIREALVRLSADGLVEMVSNRATLVSSIDLAGFPRYVEALDFLQRINTRLAAKFRTGADLAEMSRCAEAFNQACQLNDHLLMSKTNKDFHMAIAAAGKNPYLARAYDQLLNDGRRILHMHFSYIQSSTTDHLLSSEHTDMIVAIEKQDVEEADRLAHEHTRQFHDRFMSFMQARFPNDFNFDSYATLRKAAG
jgi:DNA-binding GntR family transcriptional regulator